MEKNKIKLLISPKNLEEAKTIVQVKGISFLDCKNPQEGSLGANFPWIIKSMKDLIPKDSPLLLSATIGDFPFLPGSASLAGLGAAVSGADIIKVGLKGPKNKNQGLKLMKAVVKGVRDFNPEIKVVSAGYADQKRMKSSPSFLEIPEITAESGSDIAMLDTYIKDGQGLFDFLSYEQLMRFSDRASSLGVKIALAGNLKLEDIPRIKEISPDLIGVRSVVCENHDRNNGIIKAELIEDLKVQLYS